MCCYRTKCTKERLSFLDFDIHSYIDSPNNHSRQRSRDKFQKTNMPSPHILKQEQWLIVCSNPSKESSLSLSETVMLIDAKLVNYVFN